MRSPALLDLFLRVRPPKALSSVVENGRLQDLLLAGLAVAVISMMVLPLPTALLDGLIAINVGLSVLLLMMAMYARTPIALSTFPTLLLFTTLFRLSLNIASTRSILLHADGGKIIETFGKLVVGGSVLVGIVVFLIIAIVQFIVIAKGAERVAEVGARFTLDALPGKQMSIEAELRAGLIDRDESQARRDLLQRESQLYGAMDGAMKFVKGDAVAGLLIAGVNILAGVSIGLMVHNMPLTEAVSTYTILTVGDGLVSQIPSLFVSLAAGVLITRVSASPRGSAGNVTATTTPNLASEIGEQLGTEPRALLVTAGVLFLFIWVPGFPKFQFLIGSIILAAGGLIFSRVIARKIRQQPLAVRPLQRDGPAPQNSTDDPRQALVAIYPLTLSLAPSHQPGVDNGVIAAQVRLAREQVTQRLGVPFPGLHLRIDAQLAQDEFSLYFNEVPVVNERGDCEQIRIALATTLRKHAADFLGLQETRQLMNEAQRGFPDLVAEALKVIPLSRLNQALKALLKEGVAIRNLRDILQALIEWSPREKDPLALAEYARNALAAQLSWQYGGSPCRLHALTLSAALEETIRAAIRPTPGGGYLSLDPKEQDRLGNLAAALASQAELPSGSSICVLASMDIRRYVKPMLEVKLPELGVLSYQDLSADARVITVGVLS